MGCLRSRCDETLAATWRANLKCSHFVARNDVHGRERHEIATEHWLDGTLERQGCSLDDGLRFQYNFEREEDRSTYWVACATSEARTSPRTSEMSLEHQFSHILEN